MCTSETSFMKNYIICRLDLLSSISTSSSKCANMICYVFDHLQMQDTQFFHKQYTSDLTCSTYVVEEIQRKGLKSSVLHNLQDIRMMSVSAVTNATTNEILRISVFCKNLTKISVLFYEFEHHA